MHSQRALLALASLTTATAVAMAAAAAWDRGGNPLDRALLVALSVALIAAVHLLPALSRRPAIPAIWFGCLLCAIYGHLTFFSHAGLRAGEARAKHSVQAMGTERQIEAARDALAGISARPVSVIAAELAATHGWRQRSALQAELTEARRAAVLRDELVKLAATATEAEISGATDPVTARLAALLAVTEGSIALAVGLAFSVLLELVGAALWYEALRPQSETPPAPVEAAEQDPLSELRKAITCENNLQLQPWDGPNGAHKKDRLEKKLQCLVCTGQVPLAQAQQDIYTDWQAAYHKYALLKCHRPRRH